MWCDDFNVNPHFLHSILFNLFSLDVPTVIPSKYVPCGLTDEYSIGRKRKSQQIIGLDSVLYPS